MVSNNLMVAYAPKNWVELRVNLPLIWMMNQYSGVKDKTIGIGDMSLLSNFKVVNRSPIGTNRKVGHTLLLGFGLEFPTGKNQVSDDVQLQNFTLGSKSMDFLYSVVYSMSYRKWNVIGAGLVKINTENKDKVRYGHLYSIQLQVLLTRIPLKNVSYCQIWDCALRYNRKICTIVSYKNSPVAMHYLYNMVLI
jgi:hypothetical protein